MKKLVEAHKVDVALCQALDNTNATGPYVHMDNADRLLVVCLGGAMAATKTTKLELLQAKDAAGADAKVFDAASAAKNAEKTLTANAKVIAGTVALAAVANTDIVKVNGLAFTKAASTSITDKAFADAAGLVACINSWVPGVFASAASTTVTVESLDGAADVTLEKTEVSGTITLATTKHMVYVEVEGDDLDAEGGFGWVAPKVTTSATTTIAVLFIRGNFRQQPVRIGEYQIAVHR